jgi:hypothetical protein
MIGHIPTIGWQRAPVIQQTRIDNCTEDLVQTDSRGLLHAGDTLLPGCKSSEILAGSNGKLLAMAADATSSNSGRERNSPAEVYMPSG